ncbi:MAG: hypothetical protein ABIH09_00260 [Candidatus Omnitrophota bacterium]
MNPTASFSPSYFAVGNLAAGVPDASFYIKLGSGLEGAPLGGGAVPLFGLILGFGLRRLNRSHK